MVSFRIKLADVPIQINALYDTTADFCCDYLTGEAPAIEVTISQSDIETERKLSAITDLRECGKVIEYSDKYLETLALCRCAVDKLTAYNILLFHGSVVALDGKAYIFTAKSGVGKTTHTRLWLKNIPGCHVLNGDKPLLLFKEKTVYVCGTPWQGKENYGVNEILPLKAICILERDVTNSIERITFGSAMEALAGQCHQPETGVSLMSFMKLLGKLNRVKLYRLRCNMEDEAAEVAYAEIAERNHGECTGNVQ